MVSVTQQYKNEIYAASRAMRGKVIFEIIDLDALSDVSSVTVTAEEVVSRKAQVANSVKEVTAKLATFETDYWKLDGTFVLPPRSSESGFETGWWSTALSQADKTYAVNQVLTITFSGTHSSIGVSVHFDTLTNEYAEDFQIAAYNSSDILIESVSVTGNDAAIYEWDKNLSDYKKIVITVTKWCKAYRRVRIAEVTFGIVQEYTGDELIEMSVFEETDILSDTVTPNELQFTINNQDKVFNMLNTSGIYTYLERKQRLLPYLGLLRPDLSTEYVQMGEYYLLDWISDEGAMTTSFKARDMLDFLTRSTYRKGSYQTTDLKTLAEAVLNDAGVTNYEIDTALSAITVTGNIPVMSHRDALQTIAIAGKAVVYCDRTGKVIMKQLSSTALTETMSLSDMYEKPRIKLDEVVNRVDVLVSTYNAEGSASEVYKGTVAINGTVDVWVHYTKYPCQSVSAAVVGGTLNSTTAYSNAALLNITAAGTVTITVTGTALIKSEQVYSLSDTEAPAGESTVPVTIDNPLITSLAIADIIANWVLTELLKRYLYDVSWRGNPALECGDIVTIETGYPEIQTGRLTRQEFIFDGALEARTEARGGG